MKTWLRWAASLILIACVLMVGAAGLAYIKYKQIRAAMAEPPPPEVPVPVVFSPATSVSYRFQTVMIGTVLAPQSIMISNEVAGTVARVAFESGQTVDEGQILIEFDTSVEKAELLSAEARVRVTESSLKRQREAAKSGAITAAELDESQAQSDQATAMAAQLKAVIARKTLRAPFRGQIGLSNTHLGQFLPSGFQIASLQSLDDYVYVDFMLPKAAADFVHVGDQVRLFDNRQPYAASVIAMDARADSASRNLMARAKLTPIPESLGPGDSVRVQVEYGEEYTTAAVPLEAIRRAPMDTYVYVAELDKKNKFRAHARSVQVGKTVGQRISILEGLALDETVIADGSFKIQEDAWVVPVSPP